MSIHNIPHEMRQYRQWIVWRLDDKGGGKPTKLPFSPVHRGNMAAVDQPETWSDYDTASRLYLDNPNIYAGIGFVLTDNDPYCFIDLDDTNGNVENYNRQVKVFETFRTYSELSPSGKGLHIICRGVVPQGRKRSQIELYSARRWMTMTGNLYGNMPINDCSDLVSTLWSQMGKGDAKNFYDPQAPQTDSDDAVLEMAANATNSDLFLDLMRGDFQSRYPSQSEADQSLINIIAYYTQNREQIIRLFRRSELGKRDKAKRKDYLKWTINKAFDMMLLPVDIAGLAEAANALAAKVKERPVEAPQIGEAMTDLSQMRASSESAVPRQAAPSVQADTTGTGFDATGAHVPLHLRMPPPGLLGEIAEYVFKQSPRAVPEAALCASIGIMSAMCGRCYNVSRSGLNQYVMFLARTGSGKEAISSGIDSILSRVRQFVPSVDDFFGPSRLGSGQAILKALDGKPCFVSVVGEFDSMLKIMSDPNANSSNVMLKQVILDLYQKSGEGRIMRPIAYSDTTKNTAPINSPAFSILAEATPRHLFETIDDKLLTSGLLPRFTIIEYTGKVNYVNEAAFDIKPSDYLIQKCVTIADMCFRMNSNGQVCHVGYTNDAKQVLDEFQRHCTDKTNETTSDGLEELWNRAHLKTLKLAATIAVGINPTAPTIDLIAANYAKSLILYDIANLTARFESGAMGAQTDETEQVKECYRMIKSYMIGDFNQKLAVYGVTQKMHSLKSIPYTMFSRRLVALACFRKDRIGGTNAVKRVIGKMLDDGALVKMDKKQAMEMYETSGDCYQIADPQYIISRV